MMFRLAAVVLLLAATQARAESPWSVLVGAGPALQHRVDYSPGDSYTLGASARLDVGYRVAAPLALGAHLGVDLLREDDTTTVTHVPFELGVGAQVGLAERFLVAPWLGKLDLVDQRPLAIGTELAFDLSARGPDRLSVLASLLWAHRPSGDSWSSFSVGLAWRYW